MITAERDVATVSRARLIERIDRLRRDRNAVILAHNYQRPEVQDIADFVGNSLGLSQQAAATDASVIVFCGVHFMAETAAILSPTKTVLLPDLEAGCSLAATIDADQLRAWKAQYPGAVVVSYVNTTAEVKALSDYCCTSSNAEADHPLDPRGPGDPLLPGHVPRGAPGAGHRSQAARLDGGVPRACGHRSRAARRDAPRASRMRSCSSTPSAAARRRRCTGCRRATSPARQRW